MVTRRLRIHAMRSMSDEKRGIRDRGTSVAVTEAAMLGAFVREHSTELVRALLVAYEAAPERVSDAFIVGVLDHLGITPEALQAERERRERLS